jgi:hypothetical protein
MKKAILVVFSLLSITAVGLSQRVTSVEAHHGGGGTPAPSCTWSEWTNTSSCSASTCGTTVGSLQQSRSCTHESCDHTCPTRTFSASRQVIDVLGHYGDCQSGYSINPVLPGQCIKYVEAEYAWRYANKTFGSCPLLDISYTSSSVKACSRWVMIKSGYYDTVARPWIETTYKTETFGPITVQYTKSHDPNKCHKPTVVELRIPVWAHDDYGRNVPEWLNEVESNCETITDQTETRSAVCTDAVPTSCEIDICQNINGMQSTLPENMVSNEGQCGCAEGYHRVNPEIVVLKATIEEDYPQEPMFSCVKNDEPEPTTDPTPNPDPGAGKTSGSWIQTNCNGHIDVRMNLYEDGKAKDATTVFFRYMNETKEAKTNSNGEAQVGFDFRGEEKISMSADGFPGQEPTAKAAVNCTSSSEGKVLGATTLAPTGVVTDSVMAIIGVAGSLLTAVGLRRYGKKN